MQILRGPKESITFETIMTLKKLENRLSTTKLMQALVEFKKVASGETSATTVYCLLFLQVQYCPEIIR